jgi:CRP/FNR family transcriptional regulator, cyclic AMP receptor protein
LNFSVCTVSSVIQSPFLGLSISQEEIGLLTGISRQRANQALQKLEHEGLLTLEYGGVRVLDVERLRKYGA